MAETNGAREVPGGLDLSIEEGVDKEDVGLGPGKVPRSPAAGISAIAAVFMQRFGE